MGDTHVLAEILVMVIQAEAAVKTIMSIDLFRLEELKITFLRSSL